MTRAHHHLLLAASVLAVLVATGCGKSGVETKESPAYRCELDGRDGVRLSCSARRSLTLVELSHIGGTSGGMGAFGGAGIADPLAGFPVTLPAGQSRSFQLASPAQRGLPLGGCWMTVHLRLAEDGRPPEELSFRRVEYRCNQ